MNTVSHFNWAFETIAKNILDIILIVDQNQIIKYATTSFEEVLGYSIDEIVGRNAFEILYPEDRDRMVKSHNNVIRTQKQTTDEYRVLHKNGEIKYLESSAMAVPNNPENLVVVTVRDTTARKQIENELQRRKNRYEELQSSLKNFSKDLSNVMRLSELESKLIKELKVVLSHSDPEILIYDKECQTIERDININIQSYLPLLTVGKLQFVKNKILILIGNRKDQAYIVSINSSAINESLDTIWLETLVRYSIMVFESVNTIENLLIQLEIALRKQERPQWISRLLFNLSEKQRLELSGDLQDSVLDDQIKLHNILEGILLEKDFESEVSSHLKGISKGLMDTIHQVKMTCNELRPPFLRELGLERSLQSLFEETELSSTFKIRFKSEINDLMLNEEKTIAIYRIVQELLNNASKHSQATNLFFYMIVVEDILKIEYSDDGKGFDVKKLTPSFSNMGFSGMRERILSLNGSINYYSQPGEGLHLTVQIPII